MIKINIDNIKPIISSPLILPFENALIQMINTTAEKTPMKPKNFMSDLSASFDGDLVGAIWLSF